MFHVRRQDRFPDLLVAAPLQFTGAVGSPHLLLLSGIGPRRELENVDIVCRLDLPSVGKHLKDHLLVPLFFEAPGAGISMAEIGLSLGPDALRGPAGPLPADPARACSPTTRSIPARTIRLP